MTHHTLPWQTLGTWNSILLRAVSSACIWLKVHEDHSLNTRHPEGVKKTHSAFWMIPTVRGCDGSQQGRQSGGQNRTMSILTLGVLHEKGQGGGRRRRGKEAIFFFWSSHRERAFRSAWGRITSRCKSILSDWMLRTTWLFNIYLPKRCSLSLFSRLSPANASLHSCDLSPSLEFQSLHPCSDLSYLDGSQNKLYTQKQQLKKL